MFCPNCGNQINDNASFCQNCGWSKTGSKAGGSKNFKLPIVPIVAVVGIVVLILAVKSIFLGGKSYDISKVSNAKLVTEYSTDTTINRMDTVKFGSYLQSDVSGNKKEPIEWIVLDRQDNKTLLLSKFILDCKCYNNECKDVTWETCTLRNWLNNDFYNQAFTSNEQNRIQITNVINNNNSEYGIKGGNITNDRIFCLSIEEIEKYFYQPDMQSYNKRAATRGTKYAKNVDNGGYVLKVSQEFFQWWDGNSDFWLRSPGYNQTNAAKVNNDGYLNTRGLLVGNLDFGVRPALWISN